MSGVVDQALRAAQAAGAPVAVGTGEPAAGVDPLDLVDRALDRDQEVFFWSDPAARLTMVGVGVAHRIVAEGARPFAAMEPERAAWSRRAEWDGSPGGPVWLGGGAFDPLRPRSALWRGFGPGRLVLPRLMLTVRDGRAWLSRATVVEPEAGALSHRRELDRALRVLDGPTPPARPAAAWMRVDGAGAKAFCDLVDAIREAIGRGGLEKVVLARRVRLLATGPADAVGVLRRLHARASGSVVFAVGGRGRLFLGATPEQLAAVAGREVEAYCLAGSTARGGDGAADRELELKLLASAKDRHEHELVVAAVEAALRPLAPSARRTGPPQVQKLGTIQSLLTPVSGRLDPGAALLDVVQALHPTPAVGGVPAAAALQWLRRHEGFDRGWYAGALGWVDGRGDGSFRVAIRSLLLRPDAAYAYAGCGIVAGSVPEAELAESEMKLRAVLDALGVTTP